MRALKVVGVVVISSALTALVIDASDTLRGSYGTVLGQLIGTAAEELCPEGMVAVAGETFSCIDRYEASPAAGCLYVQITTRSETDANLAAPDCIPQSVPGAVPWVYVTRDEAQQLCVRAGKRLPNNYEWQHSALGTEAQHCVLDAHQAAVTGTEHCESHVGVYDAIGNVWEWTSDDVVHGRIGERELPSSGYVSLVDRAGIAVTTATTSHTTYGADYFWNEPAVITAVIRGGFYRSLSDGGVYAAHTGMGLTTDGPAIGFRCVR